MKLSCGFS